MELPRAVRTGRQEEMSIQLSLLKKIRLVSNRLAGEDHD